MKQMTPTAVERVMKLHKVEVRDLGRGDWGSCISVMQEIVDQKDAQAGVDII